MRIQSLVWLSIALLTLIGCSKREAVPQNTASADTTRVTPPPSNRPRDAQFDDRFLFRQANRAKEVRDQLNILKKAKAQHADEIRELVLKRKGELMFAQKDIKNSEILQPSEKDSLAAPLDSEAIELAEELITLHRN